MQQESRSVRAILQEVTPDVLAPLGWWRVSPAGRVSLVVGQMIPEGTAPDTAGRQERIGLAGPHVPQQEAG